MLYALFGLPFFVTLTFGATPSHSAATPAIKSAPMLFEAFHAHEVDLKAVLRKKLMGWDKETPQTREKFLAQAKDYAQYRRTPGNAKSAQFLLKCMQNPSFNVFCDVESRRLNQRILSLEERSKRPEFTPAEITQLLKDDHLDLLKAQPRHVILRELAEVDDATSIRSAAEKILQSPTCSSGSLALVMASKAEEFFPDAAWVQLATKLYEKAGNCGDDEDSNLAKFRAALLHIWKNDCKSALNLLSGVIGSPDLEGLQPRAMYWQYYCAQKIGDDHLAKRTSERLWNEHPMTFQNLLINHENEEMATVVQRRGDAKVLFRSIVSPDMNNLIRGIEALIVRHDDDIAADVVDEMSPQLSLTESGVRLYMAALMDHIGHELPKFKILAQLFHDEPEFLNNTTLKLYFPLWHYNLVNTQRNPVDPLLILSLMRQESAFNQHALSLAGARGLMQLLPRTARQFGTRNINALYNPRVNIRIGTRDFARRLRRFSGDVELTLAAYNAGAARVDSWLKRYPVDNRLLFLDLMPYKETREYVSSIMRNYYWYVQLYSREPLRARLAKNRKKSAVQMKMVSLAE